MIPSSAYRPDHSFSLLLQGPPKTGKTTLAVQFPSPYFLEADRNLRSAQQAFPAIPFFYDYPDLAPNGSDRLPDDQCWSRFVELLKLACTSPEVKTIIIDSLTPICRYLEDHVVKQGGTGKDLTVGGVKVMDLSLWRPYKILLAKAIEMVKASKKLSVWIVHDKDVEERSSGTIRYKPNVGGEMKDTIYSLFTDVWRTDVKIVGQETKYIVQAAPIARCESLMSTFNLPAEFEFYTKDKKTGTLSLTDTAKTLLTKLAPVV